MPRPPGYNAVVLLFASHSKILPKNKTCDI